MNMEAKSYEKKKDKHVKMKEDINSKMGPGVYFDPIKASEF
jgi:hypothetical protein